ncbi:GTP pyrophosphokinase, partial [Streptomyces sp. Ncost-T10-10d]
MPDEAQPVAAPQPDKPVAAPVAPGKNQAAEKPNAPGPR